MVCGVSSLGIDHTSILGDTVEKIAWQKGGIFKVRDKPPRPRGGASLGPCSGGSLMSCFPPTARRAGVHRAAARAAAGGAAGPSPGAWGELGDGVGSEQGGLRAVFGGGGSASCPCSAPSTSARSWTPSRPGAKRWSWGWRAATSAPTPRWHCSSPGRGCSGGATRVRRGRGGADGVENRAGGASERHQGARPAAGPEVLPEVPPSTELLAQPSVPLAPVFRLSDAMIQGEGWVRGGGAVCDPPPVPPAHL